MKISKETRTIEVIETRTIDEVVISMTPDEARMLAHWLGKSAQGLILDVYHKAMEMNPALHREGRMARKIENPNSASELVSGLFINLLDKLS